MTQSTGMPARARQWLRNRGRWRVGGSVCCMYMWLQYMWPAVTCVSLLCDGDCSVLPGVASRVHSGRPLPDLFCHHAHITGSDGSERLWPKLNGRCTHCHNKKHKMLQYNNKTSNATKRNWIECCGNEWWYCSLFSVQYENCWFWEWSFSEGRKKRSFVTQTHKTSNNRNDSISNENWIEKGHSYIIKNISLRKFTSFNSTRCYFFSFSRNSESPWNELRLETNSKSHKNIQKTHINAMILSSERTWLSSIWFVFQHEAVHRAAWRGHRHRSKWYGEKSTMPCHRFH